MGVYEEMADFYDLIYSDHYDLDFYLGEAKNARGPVLEVACGTGRILLKLLQAGVDATGMDLSEKMLEMLRRKASQLGLRPQVHRSDMRRLLEGCGFRNIRLYSGFNYAPFDESSKEAMWIAER